MDEKVLMLLFYKQLNTKTIVKLIPHVKLIAVYLVMALLWGCTTSEMEKEKSSTQKFENKDYEALGKRIAERLNKGKADTLEKYYDVEYTIEKVVAQVHNAEFTELLKRPKSQRELKEKLEFSNEIVGEIRKEYGHYEFLRVHPRQGVPHLLFRMTSSKGLRYHDYEVRVIDNKLRLTDMYVFMLGDYLSTQMSFAFISLLAQQKQLKTLSPELEAEIKTIEQLDNAIERDDYTEAMSFYEALPKKTRKHKRFMSYKLMITAAAHDSLYQQTLDEYERLFPKDPSLYLLNIDKYMMQGDMKKLLWCINKLDATIGGDPYLDLYRGIVYALTDQPDKGMGLIDTYIKSNTKDPNGYWIRLQVHLLKGENEKAIEVLNQINRYTLLSRREITNKVETDFTDFAETLKFQDWKENWIAKHKERNRWKQQE